MYDKRKTFSIYTEDFHKQDEIVCLFLWAYKLIFLVSIVPAHGELVQIAPDTYVAGVTSQQFEFFAAPLQAGRQRQENRCWAACVQMMLDFHGLRATQEEIVQKVFGA